MDASDDDDGAWAGDEIPVPEPPVLPAWDRRRSAPERSSAVQGASTEPAFDPLTGRTSDAQESEPSSWNERNKLIAGVVAALVVVVAVVAVLTGGDSASPRDAGPATTGEGADSSAAATEPPTETTEVIDSVPQPPVELSQIELPPAVAAISRPTEVLTLTELGVLRTLSLPSGTVRSVSSRSEGGTDFNGPGLVVAPDAAAFVTGDGVAIVPRSGPTVVVEHENFDSSALQVLAWAPDASGTTTFTVQSYGSSGQPKNYRVGVDGSVEAVDDSMQVDGIFGRTVTPDGRLYVNEAGGVYAVEPDGSANRIDSGFLLSANASTLLVRACSEQLVCDEVIIDQASGERRILPPNVLGPGFGNDVFSLDLAPDGSALSAVRGTNNGQDRILLDLTTGTELTSATGGFGWGGSSSLWAADSSGIFDIDGSEPGLIFVDRASGESIRFGDELGQIVSIATRMPDSELGPATAVLTSPIEFTDGDDPAPTGLGVVAMGRNGDIVVIDIDARDAVVWQATSPVSVRRPSIFPFGDRVAVVAGELGGDVSALRAFVETPGTRDVLPDDLFGRGGVIAGPSPETVWTSTDPPLGVGQRLVDLDRRAAVEPDHSVTVPLGQLIGGDGRGGLVIEQGGEIDVATSQSIERLTSGELLAIGPDTAYVRECDGPAICSVMRIDRITGARTDVGSSSPLVAAIALVGRDGVVGVSGSTAAPGGNTVVVRLPLPRLDEATDTSTPDTSRPAASTSDTVAGDADPALVSTWAIVDVVTGTVTPVAAFGGADPIAWSGDGRAAAVLAGPNLLVYVRDAGLRRVVGVGSLRAIAAAPTAAD